MGVDLMVGFRDLRQYLDALRRADDLVEISVPVDPKLELPEIHRRVIASEGPALYFSNVLGSPYPVVTNLFGTTDRVDLAFGTDGKELLSRVASLPERILPPSIGKLWAERGLFGRLARVGLRTKRDAPVSEVVESPPRLSELPALTTWKLDGGPFITLPLVYTEHPDSGIPNLGMYRIQIFSDTTTGLHMQIGKGGGFHLKRAAERGVPLPVVINVGGPPAAILS
ncbi:MAG: UbiD family decarboxylase, partial [Bdellovibrionales bacterium]|nr:UbiD family decarboxylase [Bdellovibrionales bacterium]